MEKDYGVNLNTPEYWDNVYKSEFSGKTRIPRGRTELKRAIKKKPSIQAFGKEIDNPLYARNHKEVNNYIESQIPPNATILEAGCGPGILARKLKVSSPERKVTAFDFSQYIIQRNIEKDTGLGIDYRVGDIRGSLPINPDESFDDIILTETLEHLEDPETAIENLLVHLKPDGKMMICIPEGDVLDRGMERAGILGEHVKRWTEGEFREFLSPYGEVSLVRPSKVEPYRLLTFIKPSWQTELAE